MLLFLPFLSRGGGVNTFHSRLFLLSFSLPPLSLSPLSSYLHLLLSPPGVCPAPAHYPAMNRAFISSDPRFPPLPSLCSPRARRPLHAARVRSTSRVSYISITIRLSPVACCLLPVDTSHDLHSSFVVVSSHLPRSARRSAPSWASSCVPRVTGTVVRVWAREVLCGELCCLMVVSLIVWFLLFVMTMRRCVASRCVVEVDFWD